MLSLAVKVYFLINMKNFLAFLFLTFLFPNILGAQTPASTSSFFSDLKIIDIESDPEIVWQQFGPGMSGFNLHTFWHPTDPNVVFQSPNMGPSYRSINKGDTFENILNEDAPGMKERSRGMQEMTSIDFSHQHPTFGFCTDEIASGIFQTFDKGKTWTKHAKSKALFNGIFLSCITVNPQNENIWYLGAGKLRDYNRVIFTQAKPHGSIPDANSQAKIWRSDDKGETWVLKNIGLHEKTEVETIIVDPVTPTTVYASTNYGFYKSTDSGENWELKTNGMDNGILQSFDLHHNKSTNEITMYVVDNIQWEADGSSIKDASGGVFKSTDKGENWSRITNNISMDMSQFQSNSGIKSSYYKALSKFFGISETEAISNYPNLPKSITAGISTVRIDPKNANNVYIMNNYANNKMVTFKPGIMWRTKNGGDSWFVTMRNGRNWNSGADLTYWKQRENPTGTNVTIAAMHHWLNRDDYDRKSGRIVEFNADGSVLMAQVAKIVFVSYDNGDTWAELDEIETSPNSNSWVGAGNSNMPGHGFYQHKKIPNKVYCTAGENGLWITNNEGDKVREGSQASTHIRLDPEEHSASCYAIHPHNTNIHYALLFRQAKSGSLIKSIDGGKTFTVQGTPIPKPWPVVGGGDQSVHQLSLLIDEDNPNNMYFCVPKKTRNIALVGNTVTGFGIHKSTDGGATWTEPNSGLPASLDVTQLKFAPNSFNTIYACVQGTKGGLYISKNKGESWKMVESTSTISGNFGINNIHFSSDGKAYISAGYTNSPADKGGLWVSDDNLESWKRIFDYPWVYRIETAVYDSNTILISTLPNSNISLKNPGTYLSKDAGESWSKINKGNGQSDKINDIAIDYTVPGKYYVSTFGSGWYTALDPNVNIVSGKETIEQKSLIEVYPNPVKDFIHINGIAEEFELRIHSMQGRLIMNYSGRGKDSINIKNLNTGTYIYSIRSKSKIKTGKFIKIL